MGKREELEAANQQLNNYLSTLRINNNSLDSLGNDFKNLTSAWHTDSSTEVLSNISSQLEEVAEAAAEVQKQYNRLKGLHTSIRIDRIERSRKNIPNSLV